MNVTELRKPDATEELAKGLIQRIYGLKVTNIKRMDSFNDQNFHIQVSQEHHNPFIAHVSSDGYTLKIINTWKSSLDQHFDSMHAAMVHLDNKGIRVPQLVMNLNGCTWTFEDVPLLTKDGSSCDTGKCGVHLLTYLLGEPLSMGISSYDIFYQWGSLIAKIHNALENFSCPGLREKTIFCNLEHIPDIVKFMEGLEEKKKELVYLVLEKYQVEILENLNVIPKGFIHGDANGYNILKGVQENDPVPSVVGILDFDDVHRGTYIWDIGLMLAHTLVDSDYLDPLEQAGHAMAGYLSLRSLNELEMSLLKICIECRLCQSSVLCEYSTRIDPNNCYISKLASTEKKWIMVEYLSGIKNEDLLQKWKAVQKQYQNI